MTWPRLWTLHRNRYGAMTVCYRTDPDMTCTLDDHVVVVPAVDAVTIEKAVEDECGRRGNYDVAEERAACAALCDDAAAKAMAMNVNPDPHLIDAAAIRARGGEKP